MKAENPFTRDYWLGDVDPRPLALFRIAFGSVVLFDLLQRLPDVRFYFSDEGYGPREMIPRLAHSWSLFRLVGSPAAVMALYCLGLVAIAALVLGFRTRLASVATFIFIASLHFRNPFISAGPDRIMAVMSFWLMLADAGGAWSLDRRMGRRSGMTVPSAGLRLLQWQLCIVYLFAAIAKRNVWGSGLAVYHIMQVREFALPAGALLTRWPSVSIAFNWLVLAIELGVPLLLIPLAPLGKWTRAAGLIGGLCLAAGILVTTRVGVFPEVMASTLTLFLLPEWLDRLGAVDRTPVKAASPTPLPPRVAVLGLGGLQLCLVAWSLLSARYDLPEGRLIAGELRQLNLVQSWTMFAQQPIPLNAWWTDVALLENGDRREVLEALAPEIVAPETPEAHWQQLRGEMMVPKFRRERRMFGRYICRTFNRTASVPMQELELTLHEQPVHDPGEPPSEERISKVYHLRCDDQIEETD